MDREELIDKYKLRDRVSKVLSEDGTIRASLIKNTETAKSAQNRHNLHFVSATLLARLMSGAGLISSFMKGEERVILELEGNGPISKLYAESSQVGEVRGFVDHREELNAEELSSLKDAIGIGLLQITKINYDSNEPTKGIVPIQAGDISSDLVYYFTQSEQIPTAFLLDVSIDDDGLIEQSGGLVIQALPGADEDVLLELSQKLESGISLTDMFKNGKMPRDIFSEILNFDYKLTGSAQTDFYCRCSIDNFKSKILTLGVNEIKDMKEKQQNELVCKYCNEHYYLEEEDFDELISSAQASVN